MGCKGTGGGNRQGPASRLLARDLRRLVRDIHRSGEALKINLAHAHCHGETEVGFVDGNDDTHLPRWRESGVGVGRFRKSVSPVLYYHARYRQQVWH